MSSMQKRIKWTLFALAVLSWPTACILKMRQVYGIAKDTNSLLIRHDASIALPAGRVIECQWTFGYCRIVGYSCRDQQSFETLSRSGSIVRLFVSGVSPNAKFCNTLASVRASSVTLQGIPVDINVSIAISQTMAKNVSFQSCQFANDEAVFSVIEKMDVSEYVVVCRSSQPSRYVPIPRSISKLFLVSSVLPENLAESVGSSHGLIDMELWISDFHNEKLDWICDSISLKKVVLRGKHCNLDSMAACSGRVARG